MSPGTPPLSLDSGGDRATPAPSHWQSSLHTLWPKVPKAVSAGHKPDEVPTMLQQTKVCWALKGFADASSPATYPQAPRVRIVLIRC